MKIITKLGVTAIRTEATEQVLTLTDGSEIRAEKVLMSVGRIPAVNIQFSNQELALDRGAIVITDDMQTNLDKVYAIGDVTVSCNWLIPPVSKVALCGAYPQPDHRQSRRDSHSKLHKHPPLYIHKS